MTAGPFPVSSVVAAAERLLSDKFDRRVRLGPAERLSEDDRRNLVLRVHDEAGGRPGSFIIKKIVVDSYDPADLSSWDTRRFLGDWSGAEFLTSILSSPSSPRFYAGDYALGFFVMEDLGEHLSLVEPLLGEDATGAETALLKFAECLGSMHAATAGRSALFRQVLAGITPHAASFGGAITGLRDRIRDLRARLPELGIATESTLDEEIEAVVMAIEDPGPFHSYIHGDPCPDNVFWNGRELRLIDFEFGGFGHALVDATYARMFFPTCWCANTLPGDFVRKMESVYRAELAKRCREAQDDFTFGSALVRVCGFWMLNTLGRELGRALEADRTWGIATVRQRQLARLQAFIAAAEEHRQLPGLRSLAGRLLDVLSKVWLETSPLPLYPAFLRLEGRHGSRMG